MPPPNLPLWQNYHEIKVLEFLKSFLCLQDFPKNLIVLNPLRSNCNLFLCTVEKSDIVTPSALPRKGQFSQNHLLFPKFPFPLPSEVRYILQILLFLNWGVIDIQQNVFAQLLSCIWFPWTAACQDPLSFTIFRSLLRFMSIEWCYLTISSSASPFLLLPSLFPSIRIFSSELIRHIKQPKY